MPRVGEDIAIRPDQFPENMRSFRFEECITGAGVSGENALFALGDGTVHRIPLAGGDADVRQVHDGAILNTAFCAKSGRMLTGGDDGKVAVMQADGNVQTVAETGGKWVDAVAIAPWGAFAWTAGKECRILWPDGRTRVIDLPSTSESLDFALSGRKLAIARYEGILLADLALPEKVPEALNWPGSHHLVTISPSVKYIVTAMQENMLHGWRLADGKEMRMPGYPSKTRSFAWSSNGRWLATSGADTAVMWPFKGKEGPMGQEPLLMAERKGALISRIAAHPSRPVFAFGYADGAVVLGDTKTGETRAVLPPGDEDDDQTRSEIAALAFSVNGDFLVIGTEQGAGFLAAV